MAQLTLHREVDAGPLVTAQRRLRHDPDGGRDAPSVAHLLLLVVSRVLAASPHVNATLEDETINRWRTVNLGVAVALSDGLVVPVVHEADSLGILEMAAAVRRLTERAHDGSLTALDATGGTFTVSNLGPHGIDTFTPIINPPEVGILGVGRLRDTRLNLSLTIDHRALDGAPAARFLEEIASTLARIDDFV
jgi:pyruvate dehydrogenase E2 component (dihydrolipoamide acetyltransferase)